MSQKWSYKSSCFTIYVLLDANMLQMLIKIDYVCKIPLGVGGGGRAVSFLAGSLAFHIKSNKKY